MDNPTRHLTEWMQTYFDFKHPLDEEAAVEAANDCEEFMRKRGWQFDMTPVEAR